MLKEIWSGSTTVTATSGVMIFNSQNDDSTRRTGRGAMMAFTSQGSPTLTLTSPAGGYYGGIGLYQDRNPTTGQPDIDLQGGNSVNSLIDGLIYAINANLNFQGGFNVAGNVIVGSITANGSVTVTSSATNTPLIAEKAGFTQIVAWKDY